FPLHQPYDIRMCDPAIEPIPQVSNKPKGRPAPAWDAETAKRTSLRAAAIRKLKASLPKLPPVPLPPVPDTPETQPPTHHEAARPHDPRIERVEVQLTRLELLMGETTDPTKLRDLGNAHSRLFAVWQVLTGTPSPGSRRPGKTS